MLRSPWRPSCIHHGTPGAVGQIHSRIGISQPAEVFDSDTDLLALLAALSAREEIACVFVDEAQFLTKAQVWQLARAVDDLGLPVMAYGLRVDFQGELFPGSSALLALADELREVKTICHCGKKATMVILQGEDGRALLEGEQVQVGGNEVYVSLCRKHFRLVTGDGGEAKKPPLTPVVQPDSLLMSDCEAESPS